MHCLSCGFENPEGMNFCGKCSARLRIRCPQCRFENPPEFQFCGECGTPLTDKAIDTKARDKYKRSEEKEINEAQVDPSSLTHKSLEAERRQMTVMFCDLVGSTALSEQLDPEDLREIVRTYQGSCSEAIEKHDGFIGQYLGDGLLVYFGYPTAHEDDAQRAVRAGLEIIEAFSETPLQHEQLQQPLRVRIGIHTGLVVVGEMGGGKRRESMAIVGDTPNIAARLQELAEPNTLVISSATYHLVQGYFECEPLGYRTLKGISQQMELHRVVQESGVHSRFELAAAKGLTPFIGREQELGLLLDRWERVKEGMGQVVMLTGEAGIGKTRLLQLLKDSVTGDAHVKIESRCSPYYKNSALHPVIEHLEHLLQFRRGDTPEDKLNKLESALEVADYNSPLEEIVPLFASLLSISLPDRYPPLILSPRKYKQKIFESLITWLQKESEKQPIIRIFEDLHWADPSTIEYLSLLIEHAASAPIYVLLTFRPDFTPPWTTKPHITNITLNRLTRRNVETMIERLVGVKSLPEEIVKQIVTKTDGIPLFIEELTKMVLESELLEEQQGAFTLKKPLSSLAIPATLNDSLMSRLDKLGEVKELIQLCATLGKEFSYVLVRDVSSMEDSSLQRRLNRIVEAELILQRGLPPNSKYLFKHSLIQDAAYQSLLKSKRQKYHSMIAESLESRFPDVVETQPELIAYHLTQAGIREQAVVYWKKAGLKAIERSAHVEAVEHLKKGLQLLTELPGRLEVTHQELELLTTLGGALRVTKGFAAPEVEEVYSRAFDLSQKVGETPEVFPVLRGLCGYYIARAELEKALKLAAQCLRLAKSKRDLALQIQSHYLLGATNFCVGKISAAREHSRKGAMLYNPEKHSSHTLRYGQDPGVACIFWESWALWFLGYPDQALNKSHEALTLAKELSHPYSLAIAYVLLAFIHQYRGEGKETQEYAEASIAILKEHGFEFFIEMGNILLGWALVEKGEGDEGIIQIDTGLASWRKTGSELFCPYWLALLAEAFRMAGMEDKRLSIVSEALETSKKNGELYYKPELYRLKGELLLGQPKGRSTSRTAPTKKAMLDEAEACFLRALDISHHQKAKSLELRAATSLGRLWNQQGRKEEARKMMEDIYGWFTEGFDTEDLKEAKALLEELSG